VRCNNCGLDYIADNSANCPRCNALLGQSGYQQPPQQYQPAPEQQYQQPPQQYEQPPQQYGGQQQYQQPPQQYGPPQPGYQQPGYYQQPPMPPKRVPTVKRVDLTDILMIISGMFLLMAAMWNISDLYWGFYAPSFILGILSLLVSIMAFMAVLMPSILKQVEGEVMDMLILVFAAILILWGLIVTFSWDYGSGGEIVFVGGFGLMLAGLLRMGILK
jgi:hypothetical protein